jgi:hypothetical protein
MQFLPALLVSIQWLFAQADSRKENQHAQDHYYEYNRHRCVYPFLLEMGFHRFNIPQLVEEAFRCEAKSLVPE